MTYYYYFGCLSANSDKHNIHVPPNHCLRRVYTSHNLPLHTSTHVKVLQHVNRESSNSCQRARNSSLTRRTSELRRRTSARPSSITDATHATRRRRGSVARHSNDRRLSRVCASLARGDRRVGACHDHIGGGTGRATALGGDGGCDAIGRRGRGRGAVGHAGSCLGGCCGGCCHGRDGYGLVVG